MLRGMALPMPRVPNATPDIIEVRRAGRRAPREQESSRDVLNRLKARSRELERERALRVRLERASLWGRILDRLAF